MAKITETVDQFEPVMDYADDTIMCFDTVQMLAFTRHRKMRSTVQHNLAVFMTVF